MPNTASHASTRRQARTDGGGGEKESSVPELCSLESVRGQACVYRHIARCVLTTIFINSESMFSTPFKDINDQLRRKLSVNYAISNYIVNPLYIICGILLLKV